MALLFCRSNLFFCHGLSPIVSLYGKITTNQYMVLLPDHLYPVMKHFCPDRTGLFLDDSALSTWHEDSVRMEIIKLYALAFTVTTSQLN